MMWFLARCTGADLSSNSASHCNAETFVFSATHVTNWSFGHGELGSWQYFTMHARLSSLEAGMPAKPAHWQFGYCPIFLHMASQGTPRDSNFCCIRTRRARSRRSHALEESSLA